MALRRSKRQQREQELLVSTATDPDTPVFTEHDTTAPTHSAFAAVRVATCVSRILMTSLAAFYPG